MTATASAITHAYGLKLDLHLLPYGSDRTRASSLSQLLQLTKASCDETIDQELSLEQLEELSGGVGLVDAMVSSGILMVIVSQSAGLFGSSINALSNSQLRDGLNAAISADMELVRHHVADWASAASNDGQLAYAPSREACDAGALGEALLLDKSAELPVVSTIDLNNAPTKLQGVTINRSIRVDPDNANLIRISYATADGSAISVSQSTTLATPAQGWCA